METLEARHAMAVFTVSTTNDDGAGSLRQAILMANGSVGPDRIEFKIGSGSQKITPITSLPWLEDTTIVDGTAQPGYTDHPLIEIDGTIAPDQFSGGLVISGPYSEVRGLAINSFYHGVVLMNTFGVVIAGNHLGVNLMGDAAIGNRLTGVYIFNSSRNQIGGPNSTDRNILSGNGENGVRISGVNSTGNRIQGNYIGIDAVGQQALPNKRDGVLVANDVSKTIIGTDGDGNNDATEGNIISGNLLAGVQLSGTHDNWVAGNKIGIGTGAHTPLGNGTDGINVGFESYQNIVGTNRDGISDSLERNVIASNKDNGVRIYFSRSNYVSGNFIGLLPDGVTASPNVHSGVYIDGSSQANVIGRFSPTDSTGGNVITSNGYYGVWIVDSQSDSIMGNTIGRSADGALSMTNFFAPIRLSRSRRIEIGGAGGLVNTLGYSTTGAVVESNSQANTLSRNLFIGQSGLAIDLGGDGPTLNDATDTDAGPNGFQNYPTIELVTADGEVFGSLQTLPFQTVDLQLYVAEPADGGNSIQHRFLQTTSVRTDALGQATFFLISPEPLTANQTLALNATVAGTGTSEFSTRVGPIASRRLELSSNLISENAGSLKGTVYRVESDPVGDVAITLRSSDPTRATVPAQVLIPSGTQSVEFDINALDDQAVHFDRLIISARTAVAGRAIELVVEENDSSWHNYSRPNDVNGDGRITSIDALLIINELNAGRSGSLAGRQAEFPPLYIDVNNDGNDTSIDALLVINALNTRASGEGEAYTNESPDLEDLIRRRRADRRVVRERP